MSAAFLPALLLYACGNDAGVKAYTEPPLVTIQSPADGTTVSQSVPVSLRGQVVDKEFSGALDTIDVVWSANGTPICEGATVDPAGTAACTHTFATAGAVTLSLTATNPDGASAAASVDIEVKPNAAPSVSILAPSAVERYYADALIDFQAIATDDNDVPSDLVATWTSDLDGELGVDEVPSSSGELLGNSVLSEGRHLITLQVEDTTGLVGTDTVVVNVGPPNSAPACSIDQPLNNDSFQVGETILFRGTATDANQDATSLSVEWSSSLDGVLSTGAPTSTGALSFGYGSLSTATHTITLRVQDETGATCSDAILVTIGNGPSIRIEQPTTDSVVNLGSTVTFQGRVSDPDDAATSLSILWESSLDGTLSTARADSSGLSSFAHGSLSRGTHTISAQATDSDGFYAIDTIRLRVNGLPAAPSVSILPSSPGSSDDLVATVTSAAVDPEGDTVTYSYAWRRNGASTSWTTETVPSSATTRGDTWSVTVTPSDPYGSGTAASASVSVGNALPTVSSVSISPSSPTEADTLSCSAGSSSDADGDSYTLAYAWRVNGVAISPTATTLGSSWFAKGDEVVCVITPSDSYGSGTAVSSLPVTIGNSAPTLTAVALSPTTAYEGSTLTCTPSGASDLDGDSISYAYAWTVDGATIGVTTSTLDGTWFNKNNAVRCSVTPSDSTTSGSAVESNAVTIRNTAPTLSSVGLTPTSAYESTILACSLGTTGDADGDAVSVSYSWTVNGAVIAASSSTLDGANFGKGDVVRCGGTPQDGSDAGTTVYSDGVTIQNSPPTARSVAISPTSPTTTDTLTAVGSGFADADGDAEAYTYQWYVNGVAVSSGGTSRTLSSSKFVKYDEIVVVAAPTDGAATGAAMTSDPVEVVNTAPTAPVVLLTPTDAEPEDDLFCSIYTASADVDGDSVSYTYTWWRDGVLSSVTTATLPASYTRDGDTWTCQATPYDGEEYGLAGSDAQEVVDRTAPDRPIISAIDALRNTTSVALSGSAEAGSSLTVYRSCSDGSLGSSSTTVDAAGLWSVTMSISRGLWCEFYAYATDATGNLSPMSNVVSTESCNPHDNYEISTTSGNSCLDPIDAWVALGDSGATLIEITGNIISSSDQDWYLIDATQSVLTSGTNRFNLEVQLVEGASSYTFEVYRGGCTTGYLECSATGGLSEYNYFAQDKGEGHSVPTDSRDCSTGSPFYNDCDDLGGNYYIRVSRIGAALDCQNYKLEVSNGVW